MRLNNSSRPDLEQIFGDPHPVAMVTGGGRRIGAVVVQALANRGFRTVIHANHSIETAKQTAKQLCESGQPSMAVQADLTDEKAIDALMKQSLTHFGRLDALVNCAAIWERQQLEAVDADSLRRHWNVNTLGSFLCARAAGLAMVKQPQGGAIVSLGDWAIERPYLDYAAYFPSKGALDAMTRSLAVELAQRNPQIRVNCVLPGPALIPDSLSEAEVAEVVRRTLLQRTGSPEAIAHAILFFLENDFVTGVSLPIDGGRRLGP